MVRGLSSRAADVSECWIAALSFETSMSVALIISVRTWNTLTVS